MKVAININYGGFELSEKAIEYLGQEWCQNHRASDYDTRTNPKLIECIETLGQEANGAYSTLVVVEIPDDVKWHIEEYDGQEWIAENHRVWSIDGEVYRQ